LSPAERNLSDPVVSRRRAAVAAGQVRAAPPGLPRAGPRQAAGPDLLLGGRHVAVAVAGRKVVAAVAGAARVAAGRRRSRLGHALPPPLARQRGRRRRLAPVRPAGAHVAVAVAAGRQRRLRAAPRRVPGRLKPLIGPTRTISTYLFLVFLSEESW